MLQSSAVEGEIDQHKADMQSVSGNSPVRLSGCLGVCSSTFLFICLSVCLSVCSSVCPSVCLGLFVLFCVRSLSPSFFSHSFMRSSVHLSVRPSARQGAFLIPISCLHSPTDIADGHSVHISGSVSLLFFDHRLGNRRRPRVSQFAFPQTRLRKKLRFPLTHTTLSTPPPLPRLPERCFLFFSLAQDALSSL